MKRGMSEDCKNHCEFKDARVEKREDRSGGAYTVRDFRLPSVKQIKPSKLFRDNYGKIRWNTC